jgi:tetratricopeptide (TPR) repeat protein
LSLAVFPHYAPALEGLGRMAWSSGNFSEAEDYYKQAFSALALAQYATALGNFYETQNDQTKADQQFALADLAFKNSAGVNIDLEYSLFLSDHGDVKEALRLAKVAYSARPSIYGADVYAWALLKNNQITDAQKYIAEALRLGENDPMILFHAGTITQTAGDATQAKVYFQKALQLDQYISSIYSKSLINKNI